MTSRLQSLRREGGFTMAAVMIGMLTVMGLSVAAFGAANGDIRVGQRSVEEKKAYAAAEAGIAYYLQKLAQDNDYWTKCTSDPSAPTPNPVNQMWNGTGADPRNWRKLPTSPTQEYAIELLPRAGRTACVPNQNESMIDPEAGTLRIRSTGRSSGVYRSVVSTLRRNGFLDFIYFTDMETSDPAQQILSQSSWVRDGVRFWSQAPLRKLAPTEARADTAGVSNTTVEGWADQPATCGQWWRGTTPTQLGRSAQGVFGGSAYYDPDGTGSQTADWNAASFFDSDGDGATTNIRCARIQFRGPDKVEGPFHSNDHICVSNNPSFGRAGKQDRIEYFGLHPHCDTSATFNGPQKTGADLVPLSVPSSNAALEQTTFAPYVFTGKTEITLAGSSLQVKRANGTTQTMSMPANGLIYVRNDPSVPCPKFEPANPYPGTADDPCGSAVVKGSYAKSLTIATQQDVIIAGDVTAASGSDALLGLIADNYVRVKHTVAAQPCNSGTADSPAGPIDRNVEAAILSLKHVFTVDNFQCGDPLGNLRVFGAIAQKYRGPVGTSNGTTPSTGYTKVYQYDDRLRFRSPPFFITPVESAWRVLRTAEQSAATRPQ